MNVVVDVDVNGFDAARRGLVSRHFHDGRKDPLGYEKLDVYQCSIQFLAMSMNLIDRMPRGNGALVDQLKRASLSIPLNIAEGSGRRTKGEADRFYGIARGSAM